MPKRKMPARSNKGGAVRGKARAAQVKTMRKPRKGGGGSIQPYPNPPTKKPSG